MNILNSYLIDEYAKQDKPLEKKFSKWVEIIKTSNWKSSIDIKNTFKDVDTISKNIYIFNIKSSRSLCMVFFDDNELEIIWVGNHSNYEKKFNSKQKILKFVENEGY